MQLKVFTLILLASASVALGRKCESKIWKADFLGKVGQVMGGKTSVLGLGGTYYKDSDKKIEVTQQMVQSADYTGNMTYIRDGNSGMYFWVRNGTCTKGKDQAGPVQRVCSDSPDLMLVGTLKFGTYILDLYNWKASNSESTISIDRETFQYINGVTVQNFMGSEQMVAMQFGNISTTDVPASVFNIPSICNKK